MLRYNIKIPVSCRPGRAAARPCREWAPGFTGQCVLLPIRIQPKIHTISYFMILFLGQNWVSTVAAHKIFAATVETQCSKLTQNMHLRT